MIACLFGTYCLIEVMNHKARGGLQFKQVGDRLGDTLYYSATWGFPLYFLGGLAGDLHYFQEEFQEVVRLISGLCIAAFVVFVLGRILSIRGSNVQHGRFGGGGRADVQHGRFGGGGGADVQHGHW